MAVWWVLLLAGALAQEDDAMEAAGEGEGMDPADSVPRAL